jgi:hypothetical protein
MVPEVRPRGELQPIQQYTRGEVVEIRLDQDVHARVRRRRL